jgi:AraC-like DNA-binding protein
VLGGLVACYWTTTSFGRSTPNYCHRVLPDGCTDIMLRPADPSASCIVGPMRSFAVLPSSGPVDTVAVRLKPGAAFALLDHPLNDLVERTASPEVFLGRWARLLEEQLAGCIDQDSRLNCLERALLERLAGTRQIASSIAEAMHTLIAGQSRRPLEQMAVRLGYSQRQVRRKFEMYVGLPPVTVGRIMRFLNATQAIVRGRVGSGARLAQECGYYDQAHLVHEFQDLSGLTPSHFGQSQKACPIGAIQPASELIPLA